MHAPLRSGPTSRRVQVWDLPLRQFHWGLVACVLAACVSAKLDGETALRVHFLAGYGALALVLFRLGWGFCGTQHALFASFVQRPAVIFEYLRNSSGKRYPGFPGHNPLGGLSVLALLAVSATMAISGLFTNDEIASEGPLAQFVSEQTVHRFSNLHAWCEIALYVMVALHVCAVAVYWFVKKQDLVGPMITGTKRTSDDEPAIGTNDEALSVNARGFILFAICAALVAFIASLAS